VVPLTKKSEKMLKEKVNVKLGEIFNLLDNDNDGIIMKKDIDFELLGHEMSEILYPLFEEIQQNEEISKEDFIEACYNLFEAFHIPQRNLSILKFNQPKVISKEDLLLKDISDNLKEIEKKYLNGPDQSKVWERLYLQKKKKGFNEREKQLKIEQMYNQMKECTFFPIRSKEKKFVKSQTQSLKREYFQLIRE
jgi:hypothetical protein